MSRFWMGCSARAALLSCALLFPLSLPAEDKKQDAPKAEAAEKDATEKGTEKPEAKSEKPADPFKVPEKATPEEHLKFVQGLLSKRPAVKSQEELVAHFMKVTRAMVESTDLLLADEHATEDELLQGLRFQFMALDFRIQNKADGAIKKATELAEKFSQHDKEKVAAFARERQMIARLQSAPELDAEGKKKLLADLVEAGQKLKTGAAISRFGMQMANTLEDVGENELAAQAFEKFAGIVHELGDERSKQTALKMEGSARRLRLVGNEMELEGELVGGHSFDWNEYKGKVILVDFWATWCGPCIGELPNVKENYRNYHKKGFEVVGVSLDQSKDALEKFIDTRKVPWANLFSDDKETTGWNHPLATKYGVNAIPFTVLVGRDGKVIKMNVRGEALGEALQELLGEPDPLPEEKDEDEDGKKKPAAEKDSDKKAEDRPAGEKKTEEKKAE